MFERFYSLRRSCSVCSWDILSADGHTWAFMYLSTAFLTGVIIAIMLLVTPADLRFGRLIVAGAALVLIGGSMPRRKGLAIAVEYLMTAPG